MTPLQSGDEGPNTPHSAAQQCQRVGRVCLLRFSAMAASGYEFEAKLDQSPFPYQAAFDNKSQQWAYTTECPG